MSVCFLTLTRLEELRDLLNAAKHANFGGPNTDPTDGSFGRVSSTNGCARVIQFAGRIEF